MNVRLIIRLAVVTALAIVAFVGAWQLGDHAKLPMPTVVIIAWLAGVAKILYESYWGGSGVGYRFTMLLHGQTIAYLAIITVLAGIAYSGIQSPDDSADWLPWLVVSAVLFGIAFCISFFFLLGPLMNMFWELAVVSGLATGALAGVWLLDGRTDRLPWVVAGVWLLGVIRCIQLGDD
jgi:hypothetical protein